MPEKPSFNPEAEKANSFEAEFNGEFELASEFEPLRQIEILLANNEKNPEFVQRKLVELMSAIADDMKHQSDSLSMWARRAGESATLHRYYEEYRKLSERQKTLRSFASFVEEQFNQDENLDHDDETLQRLLARTKRGKWFAGDESDWGKKRRFEKEANPSRTGGSNGRENFAAASIRNREAYRLAIEKIAEDQKALTIIEAHFGNMSEGD
jgi:hypothetical protein